MFPTSFMHICYLIVLWGQILSIQLESATCILIKFILCNYHKIIMGQLNGKKPMSGGHN